MDAMRSPLSARTRYAGAHQNGLPAAALFVGFKGQLLPAVNRTLCVSANEGFSCGG
jgi:hypothetical protein